MALQVAANKEVALVDVLDSALNKGVVLWGDAVITLADVDLAYVGIKILLSSVEAANRMREAAGLPVLPPSGGSGATALLPDNATEHTSARPHGNTPLVRSNPTGADVNHLGSDQQQARSAPTVDPEATERGLAQLVLTLVELLRQLMERQALRRVEGGGLSDDAIERLGQTLIGLEERMAELKQIFDLGDDDLNLNLGPLGNLL